MPGAQHARVAEDRVERRAQLVRQAGQEVVLDAAGLLHARVQPRVLERDRRPGGDADREPLVLLGEAVRRSEWPKNSPPITSPDRPLTGTAR